MQTVKLTKDIPGDGLAEGDVISVDAFSAKALIERGDAAEYNPDAEAATGDEPAEATTYGGQEARTIDDIVDPVAARNRRVMNVAVVGGPTDSGVVRRSPDASPADAPVVADVDTTSPGDTATNDDTTTDGLTEVQSPTVKAAAAKRGKTSTTSTSPEQAAPAANAAGGDAGGGDGS